MRRAVVIASGDVQRVGYRDAVLRAARDLGISGYVKNIKPYDVEIVAEGEEGDLKRFIEAIRIQRYPINVRSLSVRWEDATGEFEYFRIIYGKWTEELLERIDTAVALLYRSVELGEKSVAIGREMLKKQDQMLQKQDVMIEKQDMMLERQEETIEELRGVRSDLKEHMEQRFARIEEEIAEIKRALRELGVS
ncbi:MAG: acylphosphatase [Methanothrix sp.]|jgi:acylphosphatase|uniref:acylphosphatase n=1 Tax=Methanothrix sp. TaxID=90426 RepID=UPI00247CBEEA|nr:acylphosphatase [Methanothrix sp.]